MVVNWAAKRTQTVCYQCGKKSHILAYCREADRIRIAELEEQLKGSGGQYTPICSLINTVYYLAKSWNTVWKITLREQEK